MGRSPAPRSRRGCRAFRNVQTAIRRRSISRRSIGSDCLASRLARGFVLAIDYGFPREEYYRPERSEGTLSAYAAHRREPDPLARPGEIDLTAHVDFTSLAERAEAAGFAPRGFTDQHHFMVGLGKEYFTDGAAPPAELSAFKMLMHPNLMGSSFKVLCLEKGVGEAQPLAGFQFRRDVREALGLAGQS